MESLFKSTKNTRPILKDSYRYIRSDVPTFFTDSEIQWLISHEVCTIVDLREVEEQELKPCCLKNHPSFTYYSLPVSGGNKIPSSKDKVSLSYIGMVDQQMKVIIETILNAKSNVLYFCNAGKDRTGVVSAILMKYLGLDNEVIIDDYMTSKDCLKETLNEYVKLNPQVDLEIITPCKMYIKSFLDMLTQSKWIENNLTFKGNKYDKFIDNALLLEKKFNIKPLLYGSLGLEVLLNVELNSDDIDLLIPEVFLNENWEEFKTFLEENGYTMIDLHEHTFNKNGIDYAYASIENLEEFAGIKVSEINVYDHYLLLDAKQYLKVYQTSLKDGYRIYKKNKKDQEKIDLLLQYLKEG